jgi:hypothetical protein
VEAAKAARKSATFLSNISSASLVVAALGNSIILPPGAKSKSSLVSTLAPQPGRLAKMGDEPAQLTRFFVRLPVPLGVGCALEGFSGIGHFVIEFGKKRLADRHSLAPEMKFGVRFHPAPSAMLEAAIYSPFVRLISRLNVRRFYFSTLARSSTNFCCRAD